MERINSKKSPDKDSEQKNEPELVSQSPLIQSELLGSSRSIQMYRGNQDSFEEVIRPSSPSKVSRLENVENIVNKDGEKITTVRTIKEVFGSCPQIGSKEAFGRQIRETSEKTGQGIKAFQDTKTESIIGDDGTRITRTSLTSRVKYTYGSGAFGSYKVPQSSFFSLYGNENKAIESSRIKDREDFKEDKSFQSNFFTDYKRDFKREEYMESSKTNTTELKENVPLFVPLRNTSNNLNEENNYKSTLSSAVDSATLRYNTEDPKIDENVYLSKIQNNRFKSPYRSVPTIKEIVPPTFSYELENYSVKKGENAIFKGTVNGSYPFEVKWYLDNNELKASSKIEMTVQQDYSETFLTGLIDYIVSLKILKCSHKDIGKYTVFVKNEAGDASCSAFLIIEGKLDVNQIMFVLNRRSFYNSL